MKAEKFKSVHQMVSWLILNEGDVLKDNYGRWWMYKEYAFWFKDIGYNDIIKKGVSCLHLYGTINIPIKNDILIN